MRQFVLVGVEVIWVSSGGGACHWVARVNSLGIVFIGRGVSCRCEFVNASGPVRTAADARGFQCKERDSPPDSGVKWRMLLSSLLPDGYSFLAAVDATSVRVGDRLHHFVSHSVAAHEVRVLARHVGKFVRSDAVGARAPWWWGRIRLAVALSFLFGSGGQRAGPSPELFFHRLFPSHEDVSVGFSFSGVTWSCNGWRPFSISSACGRRGVKRSLTPGADRCNCGWR